MITKCVGGGRPVLTYVNLSSSSNVMKESKDIDLTSKCRIAWIINKIKGWLMAFF